MEDINLHFTGDFHAIGAANNLLAAMLLPGHALHPAPQAVHDVPQLAVVHVHGPLPGDILGVDRLWRAPPLSSTAGPLPTSPTGATR